MNEVLHIVIEGMVQGVGFRYFTENVARRLGVAGWARNLPDGGVEVLARVAPNNKEAFLAALRRGPSMSRVRQVRVRQAPEDMTCPETGFTVRF